MLLSVKLEAISVTNFITSLSCKYSISVEEARSQSIHVGRWKPPIKTNEYWPLGSDWLDSGAYLTELSVPSVAQKIAQKSDYGTRPEDSWSCRCSLSKVNVMSVTAESAEAARPPLVTQKSDAEKRKNSIKRKIVVGPAITPRYEYTMNKQRTKSCSGEPKDKPHNGASMAHDVKPKGFLSAF